MNARESVLSDRARVIRQLMDYLERYPGDAQAKVWELEELVAAYVAFIKNA